MPSYLVCVALAQRSEVPQSHPGHRGSNEIDNHADTICARPNWRLLELSGKYWNVSPFCTDSQPKTNVPITKCATRHTCPSNGNLVILIADQVLWFGNKLHCSLINPHQIRSHGYSDCDHPWDPHRPLGINLDSTFDPLLASGPNLFFESQVPTDWEMETLPIIEITPPIWNPADLHMSRPLSTLTSVINCISSALRDIWSDSATHLFAISPAPSPAALSLCSMLDRSLYTMHLRGQLARKCRNSCSVYERMAFVRGI
jgi:hypothetical protein